MRGIIVSDSNRGKERSLRSLEWLNFFLADVQTGLGPFIAAYLASNGWNPGRVGFALTLGGLATVALQTPAGAVVDAMHRKRALLAANLGVLAAGAFLLMGHLSAIRVYSAQVLIGGAGAFLAPTVAAIALGIIGHADFDGQFGRNQGFNSAGNVFTALLIAYASYRFGYRAIFVIAALFTIPAGVSLAAVDARGIDYARARGSIEDHQQAKTAGIFSLLGDRVLVCFLAAVFLFHLANAAMLPQLGEMLSRNKPQTAAPFMSACIIVTQLVIAASAAWIGRRAASPCCSWASAFFPSAECSTRLRMGRRC
jgi:MFS family permease